MLMHIVRTEDHITGQIEMLCGETRTQWEDPLPGSPACGGCYAEALNIVRRDLNSAGQIIADIDAVTRATSGLVREINATLRSLLRRQKKREKKG